MLKRVLITSLAVAFVGMQAGLVFAAGTPDTGPGCGLGKLSWQNYPHPKTKGVQVMMALTNGTGMNAFTAISSGTSGCTDDGTFLGRRKKRPPCLPS